jgi:hypothetical protein
MNFMYNRKVASLLLACGIASISSSLSQAAQTETPEFRPLSLSLDAGTMGAGGELRWRFLDHFGIRGGGDYFQYTYHGDIESAKYEAKFRLQSEVVTLDWYPWKNRSFYVSVGALFNQNRLTGTSDSFQKVNIGGGSYTLNPGDYLQLKVEQEPINPYLSIGGNFFYFDHAHHWSLGGELGVVYSGSPNVTLDSNAGIPLANLEKERKNIEDKAKDFQLWPVLKLALTYSF